MDILNYLEQFKTKEQWNERRGSVLKLFENEVYGKIPKCSSFSCNEEKQPDGSVKITIKSDGKTINARLNMPQNVKTPVVPLVFMYLEGHLKDSAEDIYERMPYKELNSRGYAAISFATVDLAPDTKEQEGNCVISKWAYGFSRIIDYIETNKMLDSEHIVIVGHSRGGKTALWCGANDERVWLSISNNSGCSGAAVTRGKQGEKIADIYAAFPYWFCENYSKYINNENEMPFDQHMLLALMAPRNVYVSSSSEDLWADPEKEREGLERAQHIFDVCGGKTAYHIKEGPHSITPYDWEKFMDFIDKIL